ncbi:MAG: dihydrodipicolinate synthase family protein, partial [Actinobacteria bacterium]|nr:dihydrodipicolinate synthase family protein [Actinomycetota bacterium]
DNAAAIGGVIGAPVTPFTANGAVDLATLERICDFLISRGVHGLALPMHTGESLNLTMPERTRLVETAVSVAGGRVPVLAHVSLPGTDQVIELAQDAEKAGAAAVIVVTPYHWRPPRAALVAHYTAVARAVSVDLLAYNFPSRLGVGLDADLLEELISRCASFTGVKDASYDMQSFTEACARTSALRPGFKMMTGIEYLLTSMPVGGAGCFSPSAAIAPGLVLSLYEACRAGDLERARSLQYRASALWHLLRETGYPASVKAAMAMLGRPAGGVRLPLLDLDDQATRRLRAGLAGLGLLDSEPHGWD